MLTKLNTLVNSYKVNKDNTNPKFINSGGLEKITDSIEEELIKALPHGSGINSSWDFNDIDGFSIECINYYQAMDSNGYYCGNVPFTVKLNLETLDFDVEVSQESIDEIYAEYDIGEDATVEEIDNWNEYNACPYLDDLDEFLYGAVVESLEYYYVTETIKYIKESPYKHLLTS